QRRASVETTRLYVILGNPQEPCDDPSYPTDPRHYALPIFRRPVTDAEFERDYRHRVKAFTDRDHAIRFAWSCNMVNVQCPVYDLVGCEWVQNDVETLRLAEELSTY